MYQLLVIGFSAGGIPLVQRLLSALSHPYSVPIVIVLHQPAGYDSQLATLLQQSTRQPVFTVHDKQKVEAGKVYLSPPDYHLLLERHAGGVFFALSVDEPVNAVRPSIDVVLESAAEVYEAGLIAVLLSGASSDGAKGLAYVKQLGGLTMVLDPSTTPFHILPQVALQQVDVDYVVNLDEMISLLTSVDEDL